ncbi:MAG TPA: T9SS type A sorting domain-containing protein [Candidatus Kapabacteria bacterium]|nr:T9SS type A sorting domain-containing protein [Candidatus Kapabacteria bacterium]
MQKNTAIVVLLLSIVVLAAVPARAQLIVPSYERHQPFVFCNATPQGDELSVPFDLINHGSTVITVDSALAAGDTTDFYANFIVGSDVRYLNPVLWKYINEKVLNPGDVFFNSFFFTPKSAGDKHLTVTIYYHDTAAAFTTQCSLTFHAIGGPSGFGFLSSLTDTIRYADSLHFSSITYDRGVVKDSVTIIDTLAVGDTYRAAMEGEKRLDLTTCGATTVTLINAVTDTPDDSFAVISPTVPHDLASGDSTLVDYIYVSRNAEVPYRVATITFHTNDGQTATVRLILVKPKPSAVDDGGSHDERGGAATAISIDGAPNPFTGSTTLHVALPRAANARLSIVDGLGREVAVLIDGPLEAGARDLQFNAEGLPVGLYFARLSVNGEARTYRLINVR